MSPLLTQLPAPPPDKTGWPWTEVSPPLPETADGGRPWPRITIVTPSYNQAQFIEETIRSVLLQGYPNLEYVVIDGGSTDGSVEVIRRYEPWLTCWVSEPDRGQAHAINKGFRRSSGELMGWLNSDDCLLPQALRHIAGHFQTNLAPQIVCGFRWAINQFGQKERPVVHLKPDRYSLSRHCYIAQETTYWRRRVWETVGELDETYQFTLDYELWQRMLAAGYQFDLLPRFIGLFRMYPESKTVSLGEVRDQELARIYKQYLNSDKNMYQLYKDISPLWRRRWELLTKMAERNWLNQPLIAKLIVSLLTLRDDQVPRDPNREYKSILW